MDERQVKGIWWRDQKHRQAKIKPETWNSKSAQCLTRTAENKILKVTIFLLQDKQDYNNGGHRSLSLI
jgi:hypothetical protein